MDPHIAAAGAFGELLLGASPRLEARDAFEEGLADYLAAAPVSGRRADPAPHVAKALESVGFGPCVLGRLESIDD